MSGVPLSKGGRGIHKSVGDVMLGAGCKRCVLKKITYHWYAGGWDWYSKLAHSESSWNNYSERILARTFQKPFLKMVSDKIEAVAFWLAFNF